MSPYDGSDRSGRRNRGAVGPWVPLIMTVAVATIGFAAWVWSERDDDEEEYDDRRRRRDEQQHYPPPAPSYHTDVPPGQAGYGTTRGVPAEESSGYVARMSGALKRTPSPQQFLEGATRTVSAGITSAGAVIGNALSSIREEDKNAYTDHKTWSEEAEARKVSAQQVLPQTAKSVAKASASSGKKLKVAVVVSADADLDGVDDGLDYSQTHAVSATITENPWT